MTQPDDSAPVFFGAVNSSTGRFDVYAQQNKAWYRTNNSGASATLDYTTGDRVTIGLYSTGTIKHYFKNGVEYTQSESLNSGYGNIYIMRRGMSGDSFAHMKLYGFKIYDGSSLIMELIPVVRVSDGKAGMLNRNNGNLLTNGGSGNFEHPNIALMPGNKAGKVIASGTYEIGQSVSLKAVANDGYTFVGWSDGSTNQTRSIPIGDNAVYTALFEHN